MSTLIPRSFQVVLLFFGLVATCFGAKPSAQVERVAAAFMLGQGRAPLEQELADWTAKGELTLGELLEGVAAELGADGASQKQVALRAFEDSFGEEPMNFAGVGTGSYLEQMKANVAGLAADGEAYMRVIERAYWFVLKREPYVEEVEYWKSKDTLPYVLLVGALEDWARRNQPGLMVTGGVATVSVNCEFLTTLRLSPEVAAEARALLGLGPDDGAGHRVLAVGAGGLVSSGGVHFLVAGAAWR